MLSFADHIEELNIFVPLVRVHLPGFFDAHFEQSLDNTEKPLQYLWQRKVGAQLIVSIVEFLLPQTFRPIGQIPMAKAAEADSAVQIDLGEQDVTVTITVRWALN